MEKDYSELTNSVLNGFVDQDEWPTMTKYAPTLIYNQKDDSLYSHIQNELSQCDSFTFAVAFISNAMLVPLKAKMTELVEEGIQGRIITSNYLSFNAPKMFRELMKLPNVEVRISPDEGFHAKGYIFNHGEDYQSIYIGSSNFTSTALLRNYEWNIRFTSAQNATITNEVSRQIESEWEHAKPLTEDWISQYEVDYQNFQTTTTAVKDLVETSEESATYIVNTNDAQKIVPNKMQSNALEQLIELRKTGADRGLIISATGTGKTFLGAFDVRNFDDVDHDKRFLYIVHREQILDKTINSFKKVLGGDDSDYGKIGGGVNETGRKFTFATIQTLANSDRFQDFDPSEFDYILVDEAHKVGSPSYQRVIDYFKPEFLLGMTATPERMDNFDVFAMFNYNIAYEIRLQDALDENMLCPFHYVGVTDYMDENNQTSDETNDLKWLVSEERVDYIIKQTKYYGYSGDVLHGLIFCSRKNEAIELARLLTQKGFPSQALMGENSEDQREQAVKAFEAGEISYLITVDIFNEGIDIPCINQVVMLRDTKSSIIFIQQLGRGLRKSDDKGYLTVIDFIGNYKNNYLIPIALTGDKTRSSDQAREDLEVKKLAGLSTISFTKIARERIYQSITDTNLSTIKNLRDGYLELKQKLGRIPYITDFQKFGSISSDIFADNRWGNYYQFLRKMNEEVQLNPLENSVLTFVTQELMNGKRAQELLLLKDLVTKALLNESSEISDSVFAEQMKDGNYLWNEKTRESVIRVLDLSFSTNSDRKKYGESPVVSIKQGQYILNSDITRFLQTDKTFAKFFEDTIDAGLNNSQQYDRTKQFTLYEKYSRKDVCRLLDWDSDVSSTVYGYRIRDHSCPIFVTYSKSEDITLGTQYNDHFISSNNFLWYSRHNRQLTSNEIQSVLDQKTSKLLFIKKSDSEGTDFFYLGRVKVIPDSVIQEEIQTETKAEPIVRVNFKLNHPVEYDYYTKITNNL